jgi:hypothetical protein
MLSFAAALLRFCSRAACLIVLLSFAIFAVNQTSEASSHQQKELIGTSSNVTTSPSTHASASQESTVHKAIDEVSNELTSPFSGITAGSSSQWAIRGVSTLVALLVYGLGCGYLARVLRVRV